MKKIAIVLSGCGVFDGSEIHEATLSMLAIDQQNAQYTLFAPDIDQANVINHITKQPSGETRNVLVESARIARGNIHNLTDFEASAFDALLFPGGSGAVKNLSDYAIRGAEMSVNSAVEKAIKSMHAAHKPIGALCIAPVLLAKIIGGSEVTIGNDAETAAHIEQMGAHHKTNEATDITIDEKNKLVTTPCYMLGTRIGEIYTGASKVVEALLKMM